ncbi:MAG: M23 family metallopeptidase [Alphaproteobacteria bacterium]|nr:M23 family metallopeptidase [Alphaproteobacteria bacterium]
MLHKILRRIAVCIALTGAVFPVTASAKDLPRFDKPLDCTLGRDCWVVNYVDVDPKPDNATDFTCGPRTYEAHQGTDFALASEAAMKAGVNVKAAMDGTVINIRDGESDALKTPEQREEIRKENKDCGNGVYIDHAKAGYPGLSTLYCHMKEGSLCVKAGEFVHAGTVLGQVGQSGYAEFPHLHFGILWEGTAMDPFTGLSAKDGCGRMNKTLWHDEKITYSPADIYEGGFRNDEPDFEAIKAGEIEPQTLSSSGKALVFWAGLFGVKEGDKVSLSLHDPQGVEFVSRDIVQDVTRARQFYYTGRLLEGKDIPHGTYSGDITLTREGMKTLSRQFTVIVQ